MDRLALMQIYIRVFEAGSFSAAAQHMNVGQSAVSKSIAQLEECVGVRLLIRTTHGLAPTDAGRVYYTHARRAIEEVEQATFAANGINSSMDGVLRISAPGVVLTRSHLIPRLQAFLTTYPKLSVDVVFEEGPVDFIGKGFDIALCLGPLRDFSIIGRIVATAPRLVLGTPIYFDRCGVPRTPAELVNREAVIFTRDCNGDSTWTFRRNDSKSTVTLFGRLRMNTSEGVRSAVLSDLGLTIVPQWIFAAELASGKIRSVLSDWILPPAELWIVFPSGRRPSAKAHAFATFVENEMRGIHFDEK